MKGTYPITWLYNFLCGRSTGQDYEALPSVQPVIDVNGIEMPMQIGKFASGPTNLIAGTVSTNLPSAPTNRSRLWLNLSFQRSNVAAGDFTALTRSFTGVGVIDVWAAIAGTVAVGVWHPVIGGELLSLSGGVITLLSGRSPVLVNPDKEILIVSATAAAAVGNFSLNGIFVDVPQSAVMAPAFLQ